MEGTIGEIRIFAGNFAPKTWALCAGQLLPISSNTALFSILGTTYGGNGTTNFALPDLRGRAALHFGTTGGTQWRMGHMSGAETRTLSTAELPPHTHPTFGTVHAASAAADSASAAGNFPAVAPAGSNRYSTASDALVDAAAVEPTPALTTVVGGGHPVSNMQPFLAVNFIICLSGVFPSRD